MAGASSRCFHALPRPSLTFHALPLPSLTPHALPLPFTPFHLPVSDLRYAPLLAPRGQTNLTTSTDCSFLFFARDILPAIIGLAQELPTPRLLRTLIDATRDSESLLRRVAAFGVHPTVPALSADANGQDGGKGTRPPQKWLDVLEELLLHSVESQVLAPLSLQIETDLRYAQHTSATLGSATGSPPALVRSLYQRLSQPAIEVSGKAFLPAAHVGHYLDLTFYNLTTVALHDWRTYAEMRAIAKQRYTLHPAPLEFVEPQLPAAACLPGQTMEEGALSPPRWPRHVCSPPHLLAASALASPPRSAPLTIDCTRVPPRSLACASVCVGLDVLQIMRNIHIFVANFRYNLNSQIFVESGSATGGKHLNTIGIRHLAASIRVHGSGIMNTAVNFSFQFLRRKLVIFSQFLFDDYIKSKLVREARQHREHAAAMREEARTQSLAGRPPADGASAAATRYPFSRAEKLYKDIRKLGEARTDETVVDSFRKLITEVGNTMGYVRMVRAGGVHTAGETVQCLPDGPDVAELLGLPTPAAAAPPAAADGAAAPPPPVATTAGPMSQLGEPCASAHALAAKVIGEMRSSFRSPGEYFTILEEVFAPTAHTVPALTPRAALVCTLLTLWRVRALCVGVHRSSRPRCAT